MEGNQLSVSTPEDLACCDRGRGYQCGSGYKQRELSKGLHRDLRSCRSHKTQWHLHYLNRQGSPWVAAALDVLAAGDVLDATGQQVPLLLGGLRAEDDAAELELDHKRRGLVGVGAGLLEEDGVEVAGEGTERVYLHAGAFAGCALVVRHERHCCRRRTAH